MMISIVQLNEWNPLHVSKGWTKINTNNKTKTTNHNHICMYAHTQYM